VRSRTDGRKHRAQRQPREVGAEPDRRAPVSRVRAFVFSDLRLKEIQMNWDRIEGNWKQAKIQERYGVAKDEAERQLAEWQRKASDSWFTQDKNRH